MKIFAAFNEAEQICVVNQIEAGVPWRGDPINVYMTIVEEEVNGLRCLQHAVESLMKWPGDDRSVVNSQDLKRFPRDIGDFRGTFERDNNAFPINVLCRSLVRT